MLYQNTKTGVVIDVSSEIKGNWTKVEGEKSAKASAETSVSPEVVKPVKKTTRRAKKE